MDTHTQTVDFVRESIQAWEDSYGGAQEAVPWHDVRLLLDPILYLCSYGQQQHNAPTTQGDTSSTRSVHITFNPPGKQDQTNDLTT